MKSITIYIQQITYEMFDGNGFDNLDSKSRNNETYDPSWKYAIEF